MNQEKVWDNISHKWNKFKVRRASIVEEFIKNKKGKILDLGCGSGRNFMAPKGVPPAQMASSDEDKVGEVKDLKWTAIDFSSKMVDYAKEKAKKLKMAVDVQKGDSTKLPFKKDFFDAVLCFAVMHCVDSVAKRKKTINEIFRVLKPGSEALIVSWSRNSPRLKNKAKESFVPWTVEGEKQKQMRYTYIFELDELINLCKDIGFEIIRSWEKRNINIIVRKPK